MLNSNDDMSHTSNKPIIIPSIWMPVEKIGKDKPVEQSDLFRAINELVTQPNSPEKVWERVKKELGVQDG